MKYKEIYLWGQEELKQAGIEEFQLDARLLLEHICHTNRNTLLVHGDREVTDTQEEQYRKSISLRSSRVPLQHITGVQEFMGLEFKVNRHVLCPRQDTECLVDLSSFAESHTYLYICECIYTHTATDFKRLE